MRVQRTTLAPVGRPTSTSSRDQVVSYLAERGGFIESPDGRGLTRQMATEIGYTDLSGLNGLLTRLERDGVLTRDIRGRRTFRIALVTSPGATAPALRRRQPGSRSALDPSDPRAMLRACVLLLLGERPSHGYVLLDRLRQLGFEHDASRIYRALRALESAGLVRACWHTPASGPARRVFDLTPAGSAALEDCARAMRAQVEALSGYLAVHPGAVRAAPPGTAV